MKKMIPKKKPGRPATGRGEQVQVRIKPDLMKRLDAWRDRDTECLSKPEAIRQLMEIGLKAKGGKR